MGFLDHRRTWRYDVAASREACIEAFVRAFSGRGGLVAKASWEVRTTDRGALAIYLGRKGLGAAAGMLTDAGAREQDSAIGSEVALQIEKTGSDRTLCSVRLASSGRIGLPGLLGVTSDARFIRPYMRAVQDELRALDSSVIISHDSRPTNADASAYRVTSEGDTRATPARLEHLEQLVARGVVSRDDAADLITRDGASVRITDDHWQRISGMW
ncbi:hypothetical protein C8N24_3686 [Solirubrobacter pauli]|uniref:Uncharacterized protein n=1 Tax=Solirubrobacter pauli TaxID=166793 RepID=A0A660LFE7_9ACTN|nr:hypothetical protein [Solirubrobacter pauli]RKQ93812.1 hypothetical protein C8N24_3686 [Solirubrobacter pauli]